MTQWQRSTARVALEEQWQEARWRKPDSETVPKRLAEVKQAHWLKNIKRDYTDTKKEKFYSFNWSDFTCSWA